MDLNLYQRLETDNCNLNKLLSSLPSTHYKVYKIPKRTIGFRTIAQPTSEIKDIQRKIIEILSPKVQLHPIATAYIKGQSIKSNALKHVNSEFLMKIDLENFFNSINPEMLMKALSKQKVEISSEDEKILRELLFWNRSKRINGKVVLSVGAPSSPFISNLIMYEFDSKLESMCTKRKVICTRYADDLTFSTCDKGELFSLLPEIRKLLYRTFGNRLVVNDSKTVFSSKKHNRHVTGITLTNSNRLSIGREKKRYISALIHKFKNKKLDEQDIMHLKGLLSYAVHIEDIFVHRMGKKYGYETLEAIKKFSLGECNE
ncbi:retron St85 family RNA-directed DNA polymerase [Psychromonas arctica]|uniref:retron St85 family RNA-directed DNA polymerase n=1 Tax=Psychromonas arctica TaxID=168275 RepID=UPI00048A5861|nr:retron St85 family RNA-directed DNA polymerase [Psychromonas arctica]